MPCDFQEVFPSAFQAFEAMIGCGAYAVDRSKTGEQRVGRNSRDGGQLFDRNLAIQIFRQKLFRSPHVRGLGTASVFDEGLDAAPERCGEKDGRNMLFERFGDCRQGNVVAPGAALAIEIMQ